MIQVFANPLNFLLLVLTFLSLGGPTQAQFNPPSRELYASEGPFLGRLAFYTDSEGGEDVQLTITYFEPLNFPPVSICDRFNEDVSLVFVMGADEESTSFTQPMNTFCPGLFGDNGGQRNTASFGLRRSDNPILWDRIFPPAEDGSRWYALNLALVGEYGRWDSLSGENYPLVFE